MSESKHGPRSSVHLTHGRDAMRHGEKKTEPLGMALAVTKLLSTKEISRLGSNNSGWDGRSCGADQQELRTHPKSTKVSIIRAGRARCVAGELNSILNATDVSRTNFPIETATRTQPERERERQRAQ